MSTSKSPTDAQFAAFRAAYDFFNEKLFAGQLCPVLLNFSRHANSLGFFAPLRWEQADKIVHEISLNPSHLATRESRAVMSTLVHEMAHCWQQEHGTPGRRGYHNEQWARKMEDIGLMPSSTGASGGARTGERMTHYILEDGPFARAFARLRTHAARMPLALGMRRTGGGLTAQAEGCQQDEVYVRLVWRERLGPPHTAARLRRVRG